MIWSLFRRFSPKLGRFGEKLKNPFFHVFGLEMGLMAWPGENNNISPILGPLNQMSIIENCIFRNCFDFSSGANLSGCAVVILEFWAKFDIFSYKYEV